MKTWMTLKNWRYRIFAVAALLAFVQSALAADVDMLHVLRPKSDVAIKVEAILNAKEYVDFITYHHDNTPSSYYLMEAMRLAALKGVKVRYIYDTVATKNGSSDFSKAYLAELQNAGVEIRPLGVMARLTAWGPFKLIHSKSLVADTGDGHEVAILGGRNVGDRYMQWLDNTFVLHYKRGSEFSQQMNSYFAKVWNYLKTADYKAKGAPTEKLQSSEELLRQAVNEKFGSAMTDSDLDAYKSYLKGQYKETAPHFEFSYSQIRFVTSGLVDKVYGKQRVNTLEAAFNEMAGESKKLEVSTILFYLSDAKRKVLQNFLKNNGELTATTNSLETFPAVFGGKPGLMPTTLAKMQEKEFADLSRYGGKVRSYVFEADQFVFNHTKYVIGDKSVLLTSSNSNYSSDTQSEENGLYIHNDKFTAYMKRYTQEVRDRFFTEVDYDKGVRLNPLEMSCALVLKRVF